MRGGPEHACGSIPESCINKRSTCEITVKSTSQGVTVCPNLCCIVPLRWGFMGEGAVQGRAAMVLSSRRGALSQLWGAAGLARKGASVVVLGQRRARPAGCPWLPCPFFSWNVVFFPRGLSRPLTRVLSPFLALSFNVVLQQLLCLESSLILP